MLALARVARPLALLPAAAAALELAALGSSGLDVQRWRPGSQAAPVPAIRHLGAAAGSASSAEPASSHAVAAAAHAAAHASTAAAGTGDGSQQLLQHHSQHYQPQEQAAEPPPAQYSQGEHAYEPWGEQPQQEEQQPHCQRAADDSAFEAERRQLLAAALRHVPQLGWSGGAAAAAAAADLGLSPAAAGMLGSDAEMVQLFFADCNRQLEEQLAGMHDELAGRELRDRLMEGMRLRLEMLEPCLGRWPQALSLLAQPAAAPRTMRLYAELADVIWHGAGDTSTNLSWYSKRALLAGVYSSAELYMLTDCSPGFADTWAALGRQLDRALQLGKAAEEAGALPGAVGGAAGAAMSLLGGLLRWPGLS